MAKALHYEPGRYWGKVTNQKLTQSSTGNSQIVITFHIVGKVNPNDPDGDLLPCPNEYERSIFRTITEKTIQWVEQDLERLGFEGESFGQIDLEHPNCCDLRGKELAFSCTHEADNREEFAGVLRERWSIATDGTGPQLKPLDSKAIRKLDAMFGKSLKGLKKRTKEALPAEPPPEGLTPLTAENMAEEAAAAVQEDGAPIPF